MHIEIQVALNFVISYLYNKLPRRRVNIFGEELEKALKQKFQGHWYPDKPFKVSIDFSNSSQTISVILPPTRSTANIKSSICFISRISLPCFWRNDTIIIIFYMAWKNESEKVFIFRTIESGVSGKRGRVC